MQDPNPARHLQRGLHLHGLRLLLHRERLDGEGGSHVLRLPGGDVAGGDEQEAHLAACVEELDGAVVVGEGGAVGVGDGDVLEEGEADGGVGGGEGRESDGVDGEGGGLGFEDCEVDYARDDHHEDEEDCGYDARG
ncbi:hypothetical protein SASPL_143295 [Salvia splendens]|uniref:Uncharacterized protein n=1 Tax=Salvia splendens TaxID=180675 RepID=A0A8X8WLX7_SALSN|nr:hypothetical protein SASPL_143295 [Salvia splendens]